MNIPPFPSGRFSPGRLGVLLSCLLTLGHVRAQPTIVSTAPPSGATGVEPSASLVIAFSEAMDTNVTTVYLVDSTTFAILSASSSWNTDGKVITSTPTAPFPAGQTIWWTVMNGQDLAGNHLAGYTGGTFTIAPASQLVLTNLSWSGGVFGFDVVSQTNQTFTIEYSTLGSNQWQILLTTNSPTGSIHIVDPHSSTNAYLFYRAQAGS